MKFSFSFSFSFGLFLFASDLSFCLASVRVERLNIKTCMMWICDDVWNFRIEYFSVKFDRKQHKRTTKKSNKTNHPILCLTIARLEYVVFNVRNSAQSWMLYSGNFRTHWTTKILFVFFAFGRNYSSCSDELFWRAMAYIDSRRKYLLKMKTEDIWANCHPFYLVLCSYKEKTTIMNYNLWTFMNLDILAPYESWTREHWLLIDFYPSKAFKYSRKNPFIRSNFKTNSKTHVKFTWLIYAFRVTSLSTLDSNEVRAIGKPSLAA